MITTQRLEAFSDGVFAIAITLLILEIKLPDHAALEHQSLSQYLWNLWPKYFAYVFSFGVIGIFWANHHYIFKLYKRTDHVFNMLNVLFLLTISFLPFPTAIFGEYIETETHYATAVRFYLLGLVLPSGSWLLMWLYASYKKRLIDERLSDHFIQYLTRFFVFSNFFYLLGFFLSFFYPRASVALMIILALIYLFPPKKPEYT
ncbi:MAG: DUF1211 domain-containing protein [Bacteroidetes bacterium]|nr:DUF1211 domain-containing protein [Bacteroidota bacterium]